MRYSYSRVECFKQCPYKFKLSYIDGLTTAFNGDPADPLIIGSALHKGLETDTETAIREYYANYPVINDQNIEEAMKLEYMIGKAREVMPDGMHEVKINGLKPVEFLGFIDLLVPLGNNEFDLYDFKYSNNVDRYLESGQLHVYKYFFEKLNPGMKIRNLYFMFIPKVQIRLKKTETVEQFRIRLRSELASKEVRVQEVEYQPEKVLEWMESVIEIENATKYPKNPSRLCDWCQYKQFCQDDNEVDIMQLPKNERRNIGVIDKKKIWLYGAPFSGKTYLANEFPDPLMLNTDGNVRFVDAPYVAIKDVVTTEGRITKRTFAWEVFKDTITELEKKDNDFKTIVVDLLEDTYEYCRLYMYNQLGITHESDDSFRAWDKVRTEFLSTIKRLMNLDYENIVLISHEDTSKDLTRKTGDKVTSIKPNINDKAALKIAGMVDIVARVIDDEGTHILSFKNNEVIFGGGRLEIPVVEIPSSYEGLCEVYNLANGGKKPVNKPKVEAKPTEPVAEEKPVEAVETATNEPVDETPETPRRKKRRVATEE